MIGTIRRMALYPAGCWEINRPDVASWLNDLQHLPSVPPVLRLRGLIEALSLNISNLNIDPPDKSDDSDDSDSESPPVIVSPVINEPSIVSRPVVRQPASTSRETENHPKVRFIDS